MEFKTGYTGAVAWLNVDLVSEGLDEAGAVPETERDVVG